jgi:hypothetical protein
VPGSNPLSTPYLSPGSNGWDCVKIFSSCVIAASSLVNLYVSSTVAVRML